MGKPWFGAGWGKALHLLLDSTGEAKSREYKLPVSKEYATVTETMGESTVKRKILCDKCSDNWGDISAAPSQSPEHSL